MRATRTTGSATLLALAIIAVLAIAARVAHAQELSWVPTTVPPAPGTNDAPSIEVRVTGEPAPAPDQLERFSLAQVDGGRARPAVRPTRIVPYHESQEPLALVVLVEGHGAYAPRLFEALAAALDRADDERIPTTLSRAGPPGSQAALLVYGDGVEVRRPMGPLAELSGDALGPSERQRGVEGRDLLAGLNRAVELLEVAPATRRFLIVFTDGVDPTMTPGDFPRLRGALIDHRIDLFAISLATASADVGDPPEVRARGESALYALAMSIPRFARDGAELARTLGLLACCEIGGRYWLTFPGAAFTWDGAEHQLSLRIGDEELEPRTVLMVPRHGVAAAGGGRRWMRAIAVGGVVAIVLVALVAALLVRRRRPPAPAA